MNVIYDNKFGRSLSPNNISNKSDFVSLINNLSSHIKLYYYSTKLFIEQGKMPQYKRNISSENIFELIEKNLSQFILKAKDIFQKMKYIQKIKKENNNLKPNFKSQLQINPNTDNMNRSYILNKKIFFDDDIYIPSYCDNTINNNANTSIKNSIYLQKNNSDNEINDSYKNKKLGKKYNYFYNINNDNDKKNSHRSCKNIIYDNSNLKYNNLNNINSDTKNSISLRKKILFEKNQRNSSMNNLRFSNSQEFNNLNINNSNNITNPEIFENLKVIAFLLKKLNKENIFIKSLEAEKHKNILNNIYDELIKLIKNIFNNNTNIIQQNNNNINENERFRTDYYNKDKKLRDLIIQQSNKDKDLIILKQQYIKIQKENEKLILKNKGFIKKIIILENELKNFSKRNKKSFLISEKFFFQILVEENYKKEKGQKFLEYSKIQEKNIIIEKLNMELKIYKEKNIKTKGELIKLYEEKNKNKDEIDNLQKKLEKLNKENNEYINKNKILKEKLELENQNIEKYKKILSYQEEEIKSFKINDNIDKIKSEEECNKLNNINIEEKKNKKRNNLKNNEEHDKIYLKYELLKNDYDKLNNTLQQKQKLLDNYSKISNETASRTNIDEQILDLMVKHKKEMEDLTKKYNKNIINLKMNQPNPYSPETHEILIDKRYSKYDLKWYLLTIITDEEKNYENTFWVSDIDIKPMLDQFNKFKTEREIEEEKFDNLYKMQEKWIQKIDEKEKIIELLKDKVKLLENNTDTL